MPVLLAISVSTTVLAAPPGDEWDVPAQQEKSVPLSKTRIKPVPAPPDKVGAAAVKGSPPVQWPAASITDVQVDAGSAAPKAAAAGVPVRVGRPGLAVAGRSLAASTPGKVRVTVLDRPDAERVAKGGVLLALQRTDGVAQPGRTAVQVDYAGFRHAYGGDWASRLRLVALPECALATPDDPNCKGVALPTKNDPVAGTLTADVDVPADTAATSRTGTRTATLLAAQAGESSEGGSYGATSLAPSAQWKAGGSTGDFSWSYPLRMPPSLGGPSPQIGLAYSSSAVDGRVSSANSQPSFVGEGFDYWPGFVERKYRGCASDGTLPTGDLCWFNFNATISLNGRASEVVRDDTTGVYRLRNDDGSKVERLTGAANGDLGQSGNDDSGEYWKVTTGDGTQYFFGLHKISAPPANAGVTGMPGAPDTGSTWTVPVVGNNPGEPCHNSVYADSWCQQAYRWNLDYVVDVNGNSLAYYYTPEGNRYGFILGDRFLPYTRGGTPERIEYGLRDGQTWTATAAPARVKFTVAERCIPGSGCVKPTDYPDTPWDQDCPTGSCAGRWSPTFWTSKRLAKVSTQVVRGGAYDDVDSWTLTHSFPSPGDQAGTPVLWLKQIQHTGHLGATDASTPPIKFDGLAMDNRINTDGKATVRKWRMTNIITESGGAVTITYAQPECATGNLPANPETNTKRCMPVMWTPPGGTEARYWFHKYVVTQVDEVDGSGVSNGTTTGYEYVGPTAWHYDDDELTDLEKKTWSQWRGYGTVRTRVGSAQDGKTLTETKYYRGMHGDRAAPSGGTKTVNVTDSFGGSVPDLEELAGQPRETITYEYDGGPVLNRTVTDGWVSAATATDVRTTATVTATYKDTSASRTEGRTATGTRVSKVAKTFNDRGQVVTVSDLGDEAVTGDEECTRITYKPNDAKNLRNTTSRVEQYAFACTSLPAPGVEVASQDDIITDSRTYYDGSTTWNATPGKGNVTMVDELKTWSPTGRTYLPMSKVKVDDYGRGIEQTNAAGKTTTTTYEPSVGGPVTAMVKTNPLGWKDRTELEIGNGSPLKIVDINGRATEIEYDALGRTSKSWLPGRKKGVDQPHGQYDYLFLAEGGIAVTTKGVRPDGSYNLSIELFDGLMRPRQTQVAAPGGGSTIADTYYDSKGQIVRQHAAFWYQPSPVTKVLPFNDIDVPGTAQTVYDGTGRRTSEVYLKNGVEQWRTTATYLGDRIKVDPPAGDTPTEIIFDAKGRTAELREYLGDSPTGTYHATTYKYDRRSQQTEVKDAAGNVWTYGYDLRGRLTSAIDPDKGASSITYTDVDIESSKDAQGNVRYFEFDDLGRPTRTRSGTATGPVTTEATYDTLLKGLPTASTRYVNGEAYVNGVVAYDANLYQPIESYVSLPASRGLLAGKYTFKATYNNDGSVATSTSPTIGDLGEETFTYGYTAEGLPTSLKSAMGTYVAGATYSPYGELQKLTLGVAPRRIAVNYAYQVGNRRLENIRTTREGGSGDVLNSTLTYDKAGNVLKQVDAAQGVATDTQCFVYDNLRRLTQAWTPDNGDCAQTPSNAAMGGPARYWTNWTYDTVGNRKKQVEHNTAGGDVTTDYTYPAAGQARPHSLTQTKITDNTGVHTYDWGYDAVGNTTSRPTAGGNQAIKWDAEGHVSQVVESGNTTDFIYDANGNRLLRIDNSGTTAYVGDTELKLSKAGARTATRYYSFAGQQVAVRTAAGLSWMVDNHQGTALLAIDSANTASVTRRRFTPFGEARGAEVPWKGEAGFVGGTKESTGLTHLGAREYDPDAGRFISVDPVLDAGDPQAFNGYAYSNNNPVTFSDPTGLSYDMDSGGGTKGTGGDTGTGTGAGGGEPTLPADLQAMLDEAKRVQGKSLLSIILEAGGEILKELLGINDILDCFQKGDIVACISIVANIIPWGKIFKLPKLVKAIERAWSAVNAFWEKLKWARKIIAQVEEFKSLARAAARDAAEKAAAAAREAAERARAAAKAAADKAAAAARNAAEKAKKKVSEALDTCAKKSFVPGTAVLMADGSHKPIERIVAGDEVVATDPETGTTKARPVTAKRASAGAKVLVDVTIDTDGPDGDQVATVKSTENHPWWLPEQGVWLTSLELEPGDELLSPDGSRVRVVDVAVYHAMIEVHNLTIADIHTYYVLAGDAPVLVHNCSRSKEVDYDSDDLSSAALDERIARQVEDTRNIGVIEYSVNGVRQPLKAFVSEGQDRHSERLAKLFLEDIQGKGGRVQVHRIYSEQNFCAFCCGFKLFRNAKMTHSFNADNAKAGRMAGVVKRLFG